MANGDGKIPYPVSVVAAGGEWTQIDVSKVRLPDLPGGVAALVEEMWEREMRRNSAAHRGPIMAAAGVSVYDDRLVLSCGDSDYAKHLGTTSSAHLSDEFRHRAVGFLSITTTSDGFIVVGQRDAGLDWGGLLRVVPAGRFTPEHGTPIDGIMRKYYEELGLNPEDLAGDLRCTGVLNNITWGRQGFDFVFCASTRLTFDGVLVRARQARMACKYTEIHKLSSNGDTFAQRVRASHHRFVPGSWAALALIAGVEWEPIPRSYDEHMGVKVLV